MFLYFHRDAINFYSDVVLFLLVAFVLFRDFESQKCMNSILIVMRH